MLRRVDRQSLKHPCLGQLGCQFFFVFLCVFFLWLYVNAVRVFWDHSMKGFPEPYFRMSGPVCLHQLLFSTELLWQETHFLSDGCVTHMSNDTLMISPDTPKVVEITPFLTELSRCLLSATALMSEYNIWLITCFKIYERFFFCT